MRNCGNCYRQSSVFGHGGNLILHRCLYYTGMLILEHFRARDAVPAGIWHELHGFYETAEQWGLIYTPVERLAGK